MKRIVALSGTCLLLVSAALAQNHEAKFGRHQASASGLIGTPFSSLATATYSYADQPFGGVTFAGTLDASVSPDVVPVTSIVPNSVAIGAPVQLTAKVTFTSTLPELSTGQPGVFQKFTTTLTGEIKLGDAQICSIPPQEIGGRNPGTYTFTATISCTTSTLYSNNTNPSPTSTFDASISARFRYTARAEFGNFSSRFAEVYTFYDVTPAGDLGVSVVDPNCVSATSCDGAFLEQISAETVRVIQNLPSLKSANVTRNAIATDGVTLLLIQASVPSSAPADTRITFNLENSSGAADAKWGVLMNRDGTGGGNSVIVPTEHVADGKRYAFALYRAPLDHPATNTLNGTSVTIKGFSSVKPAEIVRRSIRLVPPPVVLVHGVWSNHLAWANFQKHLVPIGFRVCRGCRPDYGLSQPAPEFDPTLSDSNFVIETVIHAVDAALRNDRGNGIAVTQVDGVGHSMGGIVLRARVASGADPYKRPNNYLKGDFHKIITAGSPHRGSSLVTWIIDHRCDQFTALARSVEGKETIEREFIKVHKPLGPAIYGFQNASRALANIGKTVVPAHAIIGIAPVTSQTEKFLDMIPEWTNNTNAQGGKLTIDQIAGGEGTHDTIVPTLSQHGGIFHPDAFTEVPGIVHANLGDPQDVDETESVTVWNRIVELLKAPVDGPAFTVFQAHTPDPAERVRVPAPCPAGKSGGRPAAAATVLPVAGTIVRPGATVVLTLTTSGANPVEGVLFTVGGRNAIVNGPGPSFTYSYAVPNDRAGRLDIFAGTFAKTGVNYYGESFVVVTPLEAPTSIIAAPDSVHLRDRGEQTQIVVTGTLADGSEIDITSSSAGTTYRTASGGTSVISVTPEGLVEAKGTGSDSVIVTQSGKTASVPVTAQVHIRRRVVRR